MKRLLLLSVVVATYVVPSAVALGTSNKTPRAENRRIGRDRLAPLEVLATSTNHKDIRRAETEWRRTWQPTTKQGIPKQGVVPREATAAFRALGAIRDGDRVAALARAVDKAMARRREPAEGAAAPDEGLLAEVSSDDDSDRETREMWAAAICAASLGGCGDTASAVLAREGPGVADAVVVALMAREQSQVEDSDSRSKTSEDPVVLRALLAMQRRGPLDLHGLSAPQATRAVELLIADDDPDQATPALSLRDGGLDGLIVVTGRGTHSRQAGTSPVRDAVLQCLDARADLVAYDVLDNNPGAMRLSRRRDELEAGGTMAGNLE